MQQNIELRKIKHALEWEYINTCIQGSQYAADKSTAFHLVYSLTATIISHFHVNSSAFFLL